MIAQGSKGRNAVIARTRWSRGCAWSGFGRLTVAHALGTDRAILSPRSSKIGAGVCADQTAWGGGRRRASPLPAGGCGCARWGGGPGRAAGRGGEASACHRRAVRAAGRGRDACRAGEESRPCHRGAGCGRSRRRAGRGTVTRGVRGAWCADLVGVRSRAPGGPDVVVVGTPSPEGGRSDTFSSGPTVRLGDPRAGVNCDGSAMGRGLREARCALGTVPVNEKG